MKKVIKITESELKEIIENNIINEQYSAEQESLIIKYATGFAEWIYYNAKAYPDGWHYKGEAMTTKQLFNIYYEKNY